MKSPAVHKDTARPDLIIWNDADRDLTRNTYILKVKWIAARCRISIEHAKVVASLVFTEARS